MNRDVKSDLSKRVALLVSEIEAGKAWGSVLLPLEHGDTCGATLNEAEEALCVVVDRLWAELEAARERYESLAVGRDAESDANVRLRAENERLEEDYAGLEEALDSEMARWRRFRAENERLRAALTKIERLKAKWDAPLTHPVGDMSDPAYTGAAAWAAVGSEAHKIAETALQSDEVTR